MLQLFSNKHLLIVPETTDADSTDIVQFQLGYLDDAGIFCQMMGIRYDDDGTASIYATDIPAAQRTLANWHNATHTTTQDPVDPPVGTTPNDPPATP